MTTDPKEEWLNTLPDEETLAFLDFAQDKATDETYETISRALYRLLDRCFDVGEDGTVKVSFSGKTLFISRHGDEVSVGEIKYETATDNRKTSS